MIYQVRANLYFNIEDEANDFYHDCQLAFAKSTIINPDLPEAEFSIIEKILNNHNLNPSQTCTLVEALTNWTPGL